MRNYRLSLHGAVTLAVAALLLSAVAGGQDGSTEEPAGPEGYVRWNSAHIQAVADQLEARLGDETLVWETIGNYDGHSVYLVLRGKTDRPELHETESDVQIGVRGIALSIVGGEMIDSQDRPRKQKRGSSIKGGLRKTTSPGDLIHIPPGVPHQLIIDADGPYMYLLFKLDEEPLG